MKAVTWHGRRDVRVDDVPDPTIKEPTDAIIRVTSTGICGSDLHLYEVLGPFIDEGDILGHEPMGVVEAVGSEVTDIETGDRVVIPFNISCGHCCMCDHGLQSQCETTQVREHGTRRRALRLHQALRPGPRRPGRVPPGAPGPVRPDQGAATARRTTGSCSCPTCCPPRGRPWSTRTCPEDGSVAVLGLGPIGQMCVRIAQHRGAGKVVRHRSRARAAGAGGAPRHRGRSTSTTDDDLGGCSAIAPAAAARTR